MYLNAHIFNGTRETPENFAEIGQSGLMPPLPSQNASSDSLPAGTVHALATGTTGLPETWAQFRHAGCGNGSCK